MEQVAGTVRHVLHCQAGLTMIVEGGARYTLVDRNSDGSADAIILRHKALLLEAPDSQHGAFQVITPQAIAAVRGTRWAVDVVGGKTSVFVVRGSVAVRRPADTGSVVLGPGEGVDVERGDTALVVRRWPAARVSGLMARFGL
jgi:ferric-dicitrate binding protein FerR (iron transport regulator)